MRENVPAMFVMVVVNKAARLGVDDSARTSATLIPYLFEWDHVLLSGEKHFGHKENPGLEANVMRYNSFYRWDWGQLRHWQGHVRYWVSNELVGQERTQMDLLIQCIRSRSKSESGICSSAQLYLTCATFNGYKSIKKLGQVSLLQLMYTEEPLIEPPYCLSTKAHILVSVTKVWGISFSNCALVESLISLHKRN